MNEAQIRKMYSGFMPDHLKASEPTAAEIAAAEALLVKAGKIKPKAENKAEKSA